MVIYILRKHEAADWALLKKSKGLFGNIQEINPARVITLITSIFRRYLKNSLVNMERIQTVL